MSWNCEYCKKRNLYIARNCENKYQPTLIVLTKNKAFKQCPISLIERSYTETYRLLRYSLNSGMFSSSPMELMSTPNIWFEFSAILNSADSDYKVDKGKS